MKRKTTAKKKTRSARPKTGIPWESMAEAEWPSQGGEGPTLIESSRRNGRPGMTVMDLAELATEHPTRWAQEFAEALAQYNATVDPALKADLLYQLKRIDAGPGLFSKIRLFFFRRCAKLALRLFPGV